MKIFRTATLLPVLILVSIVLVQTACNANAEPQTLSKTPWPAFPSYKTGDTVIFYAARWRTGIVQEVGKKGNPADKNPIFFENKYLIKEVAYPNGTEWMDWSEVVLPGRKPFWTEWFLGDWKLGEVMAVNVRTEGGYERNEFSYKSADEALQVNPDKTYKWKTYDKKTINGTWIPCSDGPGIILQKGYKNLDWTLHNLSDAAGIHIRKLAKARLLPPVNTVSGIAATRKM